MQHIYILLTVLHLRSFCINCRWPKCAGGIFSQNTLSCWTLSFLWCEKSSIKFHFSMCTIIQQC